MSDCCQYFILQKLLPSSGLWIDTPHQSKSWPEILNFQSTYQQQYPACTTRIQQRDLAQDRAQGRRVPRCC